MVSSTDLRRDLELDVAYLGARLTVIAETLGVVRADRGLDQIEGTLDALADIGIGRHGAVVRSHLPPGQLAALLRDTLAAVEQSPLPDHEWPVLVDLLGDDLLAELVGVSVSSVHRYRTGGRVTPDVVAARLHTVALLVADLAGSYNAFGIRRWFGRKRSTLDGRSPADVLTGDWDPDDGDVAEVRALAAALLGVGAT